MYIRRKSQRCQKQVMERCSETDRLGRKNAAPFSPTRTTYKSIRQDPNATSQDAHERFGGESECQGKLCVFGCIGTRSRASFPRSSHESWTGDQQVASTKPGAFFPSFLPAPSIVETIPLVARKARFLTLATCVKQRRRFRLGKPRPEA